MKSLKDLAPGEKAIVSKLVGAGSIRRRIIDMGMVPGAEIEMERYAPLGDPIEIKVKGYHLSLRKEEADNILLHQEDEGGNDYAK
ncbi:MAG: FeoA family protein [Bacillota bacterium]|nr:FeoA family protein [Bacillota bacterium]